MRFLWDAHNCEEAREEEELVVSTPYIEHWNDLIDLWYLGMQVILFVPQIHFELFCLYRYCPMCWEWYLGSLTSSLTQDGPRKLLGVC